MILGRVICYMYKSSQALGLCAAFWSLVITVSLPGLVTLLLYRNQNRFIWKYMNMGRRSAR